MSDWFRSYGFAEVAERLLIGAYPLDEQDIAMLRRLNISRILNLTEDEEYPPGARQAASAALQDAAIAEQRLMMPDYGGLPVTAIDDAVGIVSEWLDEGEVVYMHCRAGWQRSAALAAAVLADHDGIGLDEALAQVKARKPAADPLPHQLDDLQNWWRQREPRSV